MRPRPSLMVALALAACGRPDSAPPAAFAASPAMDSVAVSYVKLVLALGKHDADYVDAYYGPAEWKAEADSTPTTLDSIGGRASALLETLDATPGGTDPVVALRHEYLRKQLGALRARVSMLQGARLAFDEESRALYDAVAPSHDEAHFQQVLARLDTLLPPGPGTVADRYQAFRRRFVIPREKLDSVFAIALGACKARTAAHLTLPAGEEFRLEYVTDKPWSGYNWYQGSYRSLIQINTSLPIYIDRALDLACHEGYPGHHVYNALLEKSLVKDRGWVEYAVYPLFSPQSLIAEGSANYGIAMAFPGDERVAFERDSLFPAAGLDPSTAADYYRVFDVVRDLGYAGNEAARRYLDGKIDAAAATDWLVKYGLYSRESAAQRLRFMDRYRSYVINYNVGQDLVKAWVEKSAGADTARRWQVFGELLSTPRLPSGLQ